MELASKKAWVLGFSILFLFIILSELSVIFNEYIFHRLGLNRNLIVVGLWVLPFLAACVTAYYARTLKLVLVLTYVMALPLLGTITHFLIGEFGGTVDFRGISGAIVVFKIYFVAGGILILLGAASGILLSKSKHKIGSKVS